MMSKLVNANIASSSGSGTLLGNTVTKLKEDLKGITSRSGVAYQGPKTPSPSKQETKVTKDQVQNPSSQNTTPVQPSVIQSESQALVSEPVVATVSAPMPNLKPSIPYPSRRDNEKCRDQANEQIEKFYEIFKDTSFEISFTDALILMPKFASTLKALIGNKEKLSEIARTTMNEHCSAVILNKLPRKLGDPRKFLIPCEFSGMDECLALADLGASINLMPLSVWEGILLPELTPTCMTLELTDRSVSKPIGIAKDVSFKVGVFHFPADFVVIDFEPDPRVPLILGRCFLKTSRALIDVHKGELTLCIGNEAITYNLDQTVRYSANYNQMTANKIDVVKSACEEYSQEVKESLRKGQNGSKPDKNGKRGEAGKSQKQLQ
nr:reverse transcriptase domain-containing protein [Tanacetum cinerariifolium]